MEQNNNRMGQCMDIVMDVLTCFSMWLIMGLFDWVLMISVDHLKETTTGDWTPIIITSVAFPVCTIALYFAKARILKDTTANISQYVFYESVWIIYFDAIRRMTWLGALPCMLTCIGCTSDIFRINMKSCLNDFRNQSITKSTFMNGIGGFIIGICLYLSIDQFQQIIFPGFDVFLHDSFHRMYHTQKTP